MNLILQLAADKDLMTNAVQTSHDNHMQKIDVRQDELYTRLQKFVPSIIEELHEHMEKRRNRARVLEICHFIDYYRAEGNRFIEDMSEIKPSENLTLVVPIVVPQIK